MADTFKALAAAQLVIMDMTPMQQVAGRALPDVEMVVYEVPAGSQAIIKLIVVTSSSDRQAITLQSHVPAFGTIPLFGPVVLDTKEWAEWSGSLTLGPGSQIYGCTDVGDAAIAIYGMERVA